VSRGRSTAPALPANTRYETKAAELGVTVRTLLRWVADFRNNGEAGLAPERFNQSAFTGRYALLAEASWTEDEPARQINALAAGTGTALRLDRQSVAHRLTPGVCRTHPRTAVDKP
jgi:hypothetical protein